MFTVELLAARKTVTTVHGNFDKLSFPALEHTDSSSSSGKEEPWDGESYIHCYGSSDSEASAKSSHFSAIFSNKQAHKDN